MLRPRWHNFVPERVANLQSTKDVNRSGRHSPQAEQNETGRWRSNQPAKGKWPRINVAATRHMTRESPNMVLDVT